MPVERAKTKSPLIICIFLDKILYYLLACTSFAFAFRDELNAHVRLFASCSRSSRLKLRPANDQLCAQLIYRSILKRKPRMNAHLQRID